MERERFKARYIGGSLSDILNTHTVYDIETTQNPGEIRVVLEDQYIYCSSGRNFKKLEQDTISGKMLVQDLKTVLLNHARGEKINLQEFVESIIERIMDGYYDKTENL